MDARIRMNMGTRPIHTAMRIDAKLLTLTQWLSPAYPVGAFAYSHGLEQAVHSKWVNDGHTLCDWLTDVAEHGAGHADAIWVRLAYDCDTAEDVTLLNAEVRAFASSLERVREAERQGQAFARVTSDVWNMELPTLMFPVALGRAARLADLPIDAVITLYLQAFLGNLVSAAQRLMPLGQTAAQTVMSRLNTVCLETTKTTQGKTIDDVSSTAFLSDIAAMRHETLQPRIFQS